MQTKDIVLHLHEVSGVADESALYCSSVRITQTKKRGVTFAGNQPSSSPEHSDANIWIPVSDGEVLRRVSADSTLHVQLWATYGPLNRIEKDTEKRCVGEVFCLALDTKLNLFDKLTQRTPALLLLLAIFARPRSRTSCRR